MNDDYDSEMGDHELEFKAKFGLPEWGGLTAGVDARYKGTWSRRGEDFARVVGDASGTTAAELSEHLEVDEDFRDAFALAAVRAVQVGDDCYRSALGRLVAGALDDARIDEAAFLLSQLVKLEPVHLRVLLSACVFWSDHELDNPPSTEIDALPGDADLFKPSGFNAGQIAERLELTLPFVDIAVSALSSAGLLNGAAALTDWGERAVQLMFPNVSVADS